MGLLLRTIGRFTVSVVSLAVVVSVLDVSTVLRRFTELAFFWVALGLAITVFQMLILAWRWRYTARKLGIDLPLRTAVNEYYLGVLINQLLPGGIAGDLSRAWRLARSSAPTGRAVRAVVLERASAQVVMTTVALTSLLFLPMGSGLARVLTAGIGLLGLGGVLLFGLRRATPTSITGQTWLDMRRAFFNGKALPVQLLTAISVVGLYLILYLITSRAVGVTTPMPQLLPLVAPVLMAMLIPFTVAGWGVREGVAAMLWSLAGLTPEEGVAISVAYGLLVLVSTIPGVPILILTLTEARSRRAHPCRGRTAGKGSAAPPLESARDQE